MATTLECVAAAELALKRLCALHASGPPQILSLQKLVSSLVLVLSDKVKNTPQILLP